MKNEKSGSTWFVISWHLLAALAVASVSQLWFGRLEHLPVRYWPVVVGAALTYLAAASATVFLRTRGDWRPMGALFAVVLPVAVYLLFLIVTGAAYSRGSLVLTLLLVPVLLLASTTAQHRLRWVGLAALLAVTATTHERAAATEAPEVVSTTTTGAYMIRAHHFDSLVGTVESTGGGLAAFDRDRYLLGTGDGAMFLLTWDAEHARLDSHRLSLRIPMAREAFMRALPNPDLPEAHFFRTGAILSQPLGERFRLFAAYQHWNEASGCATVRVSYVESRYDEFVAQAEHLAWTTVFESHPCLAMKSTSWRIAGHQSGAKLALLDENRLIVAVGDHEYDGVSGVPILPQDPTNSYGKTILVDLRTGAASVYSLGHRNAEGLGVTEDGQIWQAEHGPQGGDELNLILRGENYGWPYATYGSEYGQTFWPGRADAGDHIGYRRPVYAWMPSIAVSDLIALRSPAFGAWRDDLVVGALGGQSLFHLRVREGRVVFQEKIFIGKRVRAILEDPEGRLVLWTEGGFDAPTTGSVVMLEFEPLDREVSAASLATPEGRQNLLAIRCGGCHNLGEGSGGLIGPSLAAVVGRPVANVSGFGYSPALRSLGGSWSIDRIDAFIKNPATMAPGTLMQIPGIADVTERAALIEALRGLSGP
jgi:cytochrome c2